MKNTRTSNWYDTLPTPEEMLALAMEQEQLLQVSDDNESNHKTNQHSTPARWALRSLFAQFL